MSREKTPDEIAGQAQDASNAGDHRRAEELWLKASQMIASQTSPAAAKLRRAWDAAAKRARRLDTIQKEKP